MDVNEGGIGVDEGMAIGGNCEYSGICGAMLTTGLWWGDGPAETP